METSLARYVSSSQIWIENMGTKARKFTMNLTSHKLHPYYVQEKVKWCHVMTTSTSWNKVVARSYNYHSHNFKKYNSHHLQYSLKKCRNKKWTNLLNKLKRWPQEVTMV
jgi:hypothetical protein